MLVDNLSQIRQRLLSSVPPSLGVRQYIPVTIHWAGAEYLFTAKVTELTAGQKVNYLNLGVNVNSETRLIDNIPLSVPLEALQHGQYTYNGVTADVLNVNTTKTVTYSATVQEYRDR